VPWILGLLASVVLAAPFGSASAAAVGDTDGLEVLVTVEYESGAEAVIARPFSRFEELPPTAMVNNGDGTWTAVVRLPTFENWSVAFEAFPAGGGSDVSDGATLLDMGVDPVVISPEVETPLPSNPLIPDGSWWLIAGVGLAVAALIALSIWTFGGDPEDQEPVADEQSEAVED
jgi:hypothetical protein